MTGAKASVSYDDGAAWGSADIRRTDGNSFQATVRHAKRADTNG
jgi:hypothetical protein